VVSLLTAACTNLAALNQKLVDVEYATGELQYTLDREATKVRFSAGDTDGRFSVADARLTFPATEITDAILEVTLATGSLDVTNPLVQQMLRGQDWFDVKNHPLARFATRSIVIENPQQVRVQGVLVVKEIEQPLLMEVAFAEGLPDLQNPPTRIPFQARGAFLRSSYGMTDLMSMAPDEVVVTVEGAFEKLP
jgi:polyisoprenoid-binding protein YceI